MPLIRSTPYGPARRDAVATFMVFATSALFLSWTTLPGMHWFDSPEFAATAWRLSLSHPPGHPAHALTTRAVQLLPFGDIAFRSNVASALALSLGLALLYRLFRRLAPDAPWWGALFAALLPAVMPAIWLQGVRAEVYALQVLMSVGCASLAFKLFRGDDDRWLPAAALCFGLAGTNHSLIGLTIAPLALVGAWVGYRRRWRPWIWAVPLATLGLLTYLYLFIRAHAGAEVGWGTPDSLDRLIHTIAARDWSKVAPERGAPFDLGVNIIRIVVYAVTQVGGVAALMLCLVGALGFALGERPQKIRLLGALGVAVCAFATKAYFSFDALNPDVGGYFAGGLLALVATAWLGVAALQARWGVWPAIVFPLALVLAAPGFDAGGRLGARAAGRTARVVLSEVPVGGAIVYSDFSSWFGALYLRAAEGARPDVALVYRGRIDTEWLRERLSTQAPRWAERLTPNLTGFTGPSVRYEPGVEMHRLGALADRLVPVGLTWAVDARYEPGAVERAFKAAHTSGADLDTRRLTAVAHLSRAMVLVDRRPLPAPLRALARWHLGVVSALAPGDPFPAQLTVKLRQAPQ